VDEVVEISGIALKERIEELEREYAIKITACDELGYEVAIADLSLYRVTNQIRILGGNSNGWK